MKRKRPTDDSGDYSDDEDISLLEVKRRRADAWTNYLVDEATGSAVCVLCLKSFKLDTRNGGMCPAMIEHYERGCEDPGSVVTECSVVLKRLSPALLQKYALPDFELTPVSDKDGGDYEVLSEGMHTPTFSDSEDQESTEEMTQRLLAKYDVVDAPPTPPSPSSAGTGAASPTEMDEVSQTLNKM